MSEATEMAKDQASKALDKEIERIKSLPRDSEFVKANQHIVDTDVAAVPKWAAAGLLSAVGAYWYKISCDLVIVGAGIGALDFSASGTDWVAVVVECELAGFFVVNPADIAGDCGFLLVVGAVGEGAVSLTLHGSSGQFYGTFAGNADGAGAGKMSDTGKLIVATT